ncbi:MAG: 2-amino-4-hydroxy-6-hydroxymethyldihydropteridine diphosphokinase [bacterium]
MPHKSLIGFGSNLGDRRANIAEALDKIRELPDTRILRKASLYESEPHGNAKTWFYNSACELETELSPQDLLKSLLEIETVMGRRRVKGKKFGSRVIDLDLLFYENIVLNGRKLKLPHPRLTKRRFVLLPLAEIAPQHNHPESGQTISQLLATSDDNKKVTLLPPR